MADDLAHGGPTAGAPRPNGAASAGGLGPRQVDKRYGGTLALNRVSLTVVPGQVMGLVGHNGAGKSTLLRILSGAERPDAGSVWLDGSARVFSAPSDAIKAGVGCVYQELSLVPQLSVSQSVFLGQETVHRGRLSKRAMERAAQELCDSFNVGVRANELIGELSIAHRQLVEIVAAFHRNARFLLLDEPTTALEVHQVEHLLGTVRQLVEAQNLGVLLVDHKLDEVFAVADHIVAMSDGRIVLESPASEVDRSQVVSAIVGDTAGPGGRVPSGPEHARPGRPGVAPNVFPAATAPAAGLRVQDARSPRLRGVSLSVAPGHVVALYGLMGSGRSRMLRALSGAEPLTSGVMELDGKLYSPRSPRAAMAAGASYLPEDRKEEGIIPSLRVTDNVTLPVLGQFSHHGVLRRRAARKAAVDVLNQMRVRGDLNKSAASLSGGNQQKVLFARAILQSPRLLLLDEPTKGVDIGVKEEIHQLIREIARTRHIPILVSSSEEEEVLVLADEVAVLRNGSCAGALLPTSELTVSLLRRLALGESAQLGTTGAVPEGPGVS